MNLESPVPLIIADDSSDPATAPVARASRHDGHQGLPWWLAIAAALCGAGVALFYWRTGLTLSHYDAKAHLVVARRILDSLTPGWVQIGAVWLPLPHLINLFPVQIDLLYRTGASAIAVSVASYAAATYAIARLILLANGSRAAAVLGAAVFALNPDVLYLQSTPMTEPLLMGLTSLAVVFGIEAFETGDPSRIRQTGLLLAAASLTRYEAWPVTAAILGLGLAGLAWRGTPLQTAAGRVLRVAIYPILAILGFLLLSRASVGEWFVQTGFFVPDNLAMHLPARAAVSVWWGTHELMSYPLVVLGSVGLLAPFLGIVRDRSRALLIVPLALVAVVALPWYAFYEGHPFRIRYMTPLVPVVALGVGLAVGAVWRARFVVGALAAIALAAGPRPLDATAPMVLEAQWDREHRLGRAAVTAYLRGHWDGQPIMASMGSLAHYMQELSASGYRLRDFLHEGNGDIWLAALDDPHPHAAWILVEEQAEGGDMLAAIARRRPRFLDGYSRVADGGGVALYRRQPRTDSGMSTAR